MPVTTRSQSRALAAATTTLAVTPEEETTTQDAIESSPAAIEPAATEPVAIEPAAAPTIPIVPRPRKPKRPRSTTEPGIKGPANAPKRTKTMPTYNEQVDERLDRALKQRMYVVNRTLQHHHHIQFHVLGSTGNYYTVDITNTMKCNCLDYRYRRLHCKHLLLVLARVFHVQKGSPAYSKLHLTNQELQDVFANCTPEPSVMVSDTVKELINNKLHGVPVVEEESSVQRRDLDEVDCPICYESLAEEPLVTITFCRTCGNNVHQDCFNKWSQQLTRQRLAVTCVFCRSEWKLPKPIAPPKKSIQGFVNFAEDSGLPFELQELHPS
ncbi:hypothetical protein LRAMOSA09398 [Lichtheimia ramosa]|uniref:SWIM-type domain-containing protein n=1 Tax=Lichtheimia ramosa TaxID=688394 RepID=A0A077WIH5_9FUNG|nr:hypothetical protein LRAMOSA09398 [Lichtheimia ramosa]